MKDILKYIQDGVNIEKRPGGYMVFTILTQHFWVDSLDDLTAERFEQAITDLADRNKMEEELFRFVTNS